MLTMLRAAGTDGVMLDALSDGFGPEVDTVIAELRGRGHCVQTTTSVPGRVILHEVTPGKDVA